VTLAHWDEIEAFAAEMAPMGGRWRNLGEAAGSIAIGARRIEVADGLQSTPVHSHGAEEEIVYVLAGGGLLWQEGTTHVLREGDVVVQRAGGAPHTLIGPLDVIVFGTRARVELGHLPRAGLGWLGPHAWVEVEDPAVEHPWIREAKAGPLELAAPSPKPDNAVATADVDPAPMGDGRVRRAGAAAGAMLSDLNRVELPPGATGAALHCHSAEEELFVVLDGDGILRLGDEEIPVRPGSVVSRPAGTRVAHRFRAGGAGLTFLAYSDRHPDDAVLYPERGVVLLAGLGVTVPVVEGR